MKHTLSLLLLLAVTLCGCSLDSIGATPTATLVPTITPTPTATPVPMAVVVNGEGIPILEFNAEVARYLAAQGALGNSVPETDAEETVLEDLINQVLLAQGAAADGYVVDDAILQARIDALVAQLGSEQALFDWEAAHGYTDAEFRSALRRQVAAAWMRDSITAEVPAVADQVHVKQILLYNADTAAQVWGQLQAGADFETLAAQYDPVTQGELGWSPEGYLLDPGIEAVVFSLEPGQYSDVLDSDAGYHIIMVLEREEEHELTPDARLTLQMQALENWLEQQRGKSVITVTP